jgi:hypothetical protein
MIGDAAIVVHMRVQLVNFEPRRLRKWVYAPGRVHRSLIFELSLDAVRNVTERCTEKFIPRPA